MTDSNVYIVIGITGEHSDRCEWNVAAFDTRCEAEDWKNLCQKWADAIKDPCWFNEAREKRVSALTDKYLGEHPRSDDDIWRDANRRARKEVAEKYNPYDPYMLVDYLGTRYCLNKVPFNIKKKADPS